MFASRTLRRSPVFTIAAAATYVVMGSAFFAIALVSLWLPARRAAALGPTAALREF